MTAVDTNFARFDMLIALADDDDDDNYTCSMYVYNTLVNFIQYDLYACSHCLSVVRWNVQYVRLCWTLLHGVTLRHSSFELKHYDVFTYRYRLWKSFLLQIAQNIFGFCTN